MNVNPTYKVGELFTEAEIAKAIKLYASTPSHLFAQRCDVEVVAPALDRINLKTGQQNSSRYLAYMLQNLFNMSGSGM
jgi:hypothetical protein